MAIRSQGFVHPATLVPDELEYGVGYRAKISILWSRMKPIPGASPNVKQRQKPNQNNKPRQSKVKSHNKVNDPHNRIGKQKPQQGQRPPQQGQKPQKTNSTTKTTTG